MEYNHNLSRMTVGKVWEKSCIPKGGRVKKKVHAAHTGPRDHKITTCNICTDSLSNNTSQNNPAKQKSVSKSALEKIALQIVCGFQNHNQITYTMQCMLMNMQFAQWRLKVYCSSDIHWRGSQMLQFVLSTTKCNYTWYCNTP